MTEALENLERQIDELRAQVRRAATSGDPVRARELRADLRRMEQVWENALAALTAPVVDMGAPAQAGSILPAREQVHQALVLLAVPSAPKLVVSVHTAVFGGDLSSVKLTSLKRDEERSFRSSPHARPYYLCNALTYDRLVPARGLVAVSTWPLARRVVGPLSARVDFLRVGIALAHQVERMSTPTAPVLRLLWQYAANIPDAAPAFDAMQPAVVATAATAELSVHEDADLAHREEAAERARTQLDETHLLFGSSLKVVRRIATDS
ncbi:hypothetical protein [Actinokineospora globicatena]|uniref:hypothetical protein n=1 Tax=Actinokineospora globicatena TaxID=103729 RepID=UPI0020A2EFDD|nr:hypothetical protein [Actinokineospora globicatena]MCP2302957.1 hypothetical protein [Actinokineospora globicatena]GLW78654.1 hypothetical protein Aglo01_31360 [Actinokineospora globicatena]GLW84678.1 hypothetical protein Aglo02_23180 [Actinokineospora globicatena]